MGPGGGALPQRRKSAGRDCLSSTEKQRWTKRGSNLLIPRRVASDAPLQHENHTDGANQTNATILISAPIPGQWATLLPLHQGLVAGLTTLAFPVSRAWENSCGQCPVRHARIFWCRDKALRPFVPSIAVSPSRTVVPGAPRVNPLISWLSVDPLVTWVGRCKWAVEILIWGASSFKDVLDVNHISPSPRTQAKAPQHLSQFLNTGQTLECIPVTSAPYKI